VPDKSEITIHQLLRHSSGLPGVVGGDYDKITESEFIKKVFETPLKFPSGERFAYSNVGYSLLGLIIEKVSGLPYEQFLYDNLWKPAGMESTGYTRPHFAENLIAVGYRSDEHWGKPTEKAWDADAPFWHLKANGGILSTTEDLYKWNQALSSDKILSSAAKEKYYRPKLRPNENDNPYYAYGWDVLKTKRNTILARHNGSNRIFYADFHRYLDEGITIIVLSNKAHSNFLRANNEISKIIFDSAFKPLIPVADNAPNRNFTDEIIKSTLEKGFEAGAQNYKKRSSAVNLLEDVVNGKGYNLLSNKKFSQAIEIFKLNTLAFPTSANAFDSLGEAYMEAGEKILAIENYKKSLLLNPDNKNAEEMLKSLVDR
jgi:CubicO group peptidase (beta-lactamase class C family)